LTVVIVVQVHVKEKTIVVHCGEGNQRIQWLSHVGIARYDSNFGLELGVPKGIQNDDGKLYDSNAIIKHHITDNQHVWVLIQGVYFINSQWLCSVTIPKKKTGID
jgi:hypothetical protein